MHRWLLWLLVFSTFSNGSMVVCPDHDEEFEQAAFGIQHPASSLADAHHEHHFCNHSCHASAHVLGMTVTALTQAIAPCYEEQYAYLSKDVAAALLPPPTPRPKLL